MNTSSKKLPVFERTIKNGPRHTLAGNVYNVFRIVNGDIGTKTPTPVATLMLNEGGSIELEFGDIISGQFVLRDSSSTGVTLRDDTTWESTGSNPPILMVY